MADAPSSPSSSSSSTPTLTHHYLMRELEEPDYGFGHLALLGQLTDVGYMEFSEYGKILEKIKSQGSKVYVIQKLTKNDKDWMTDISIVATGTLFIEQKFIHSGGKVGHIEDVVVDKAERKKGFGAKLVNQLISTARAQGCYKVILDCSADNVDFYKGLGFVEKEKQMAFYLK